MGPKVSIIIPCFNQEQFLEDTLKSVFNQTYDNWECLIIDDESTDSSTNIAERWCKQDSRYKLFQKKNGGISSARNYGLNHATGDYIQFLDGDDLLCNNKLDTSLTHAKNNEEVIITSFNHIKNGKKLPPFCNLRKDYFTYENILLKWDADFSIPIHCGLFKKSTVGDFRFDDKIIAGEDWIFWLFLYEKRSSTCFINEELVVYRLHDKSITHNDDRMAEKKQIAHLKIYNSLSNDNKTLFFERFSVEVLNLRARLNNIHQQNEKKKERKLSRRIKRFFLR